MPEKRKFRIPTDILGVEYVGHSIALAALALVVFGAYDSYPKKYIVAESSLFVYTRRIFVNKKFLQKL